MSTPTPRHGPGQTPPGMPGQPPGWPVPQPPKKRGGVRGLLIGLGVAVVFFGGLAALGVATGDDTGSTATATRPAAATASPTAVLEAMCEASMRADIETEADETLSPACYELGREGAQAILDRIAAEKGIDTSAAAKPAAPNGVTVSGDYAGSVTIRSFRAKRDALDSFSVALRLQNTGGDDIEWMSVKVTALRGEEIVATGDGLVESIAAGQTITTETISTDDFPASAKGITYEVELGS